MRPDRTEYAALCSRKRFTQACSGSPTIEPKMRWKWNGEKWPGAPLVIRQQLRRVVLDGAVSGRGFVAFPSHAHEERGKSSPFAVRSIDIRAIKRFGPASYDCADTSCFIGTSFGTAKLRCNSACRR